MPHKLIDDDFTYVRAIVCKYCKRRNIHLEQRNDLIQYGHIALMKAARTYKSFPGSSFRAYAVKRVKWALLDEYRSWTHYDRKAKTPRDKKGVLDANKVEGLMRGLRSDQDVEAEASARSEVEWLLSIANKREKVILRGILDGMTQRMTAAILGVCEGRVCQMLAAFRRKVKRFKRVA